MKSPLGKLNRIKYKLTISLVAAVAITMGASWLVFDRLVNRAISIALNEDVEEGLKLGLQSRRDLFDAKKEAFRATTRGHGRDHRLVGAVRAADETQVEEVLEQMLKEHPGALIYRVTMKDPSRSVSVQRDSDQFPEKQWRRFDVETDVGEGNALLQETYVVRWSMFEEFDEAGRVLKTFQTFRRNREDFRVGFVWFYLVTVGALSMVVGTGVFLYSLRTGRRIGRLSRATQRVGRGDLDVTVEDPAGDELSDLAAAFNEMVREIRTSRERIEYLQRVSAWQEFARRLAHEIKNPLTPIQLAIQEIRSTYRGEDERFKAVLQESYEIIDEEISVLRKLTGEFSSFARLPRVTPRPMALTEFLEDVLPSLTSFARNSSVHLEIEDEAPDAVVEIDSTMLRRVLDNLVRNAVQAVCRKGEPDGLVVIRSSTPDRRTVHVRVEDTGPGIDPDHVGDVFAPYYTTRAEGTGLGLAISKKIVLEHGGNILVEKTGQDGTTFLIELPSH